MTTEFNQDQAAAEQAELNKELREAFYDGKHSKVEECLKKGADANMIEARNTTLLYKAIHNGDKKMMEILIQYGANPEIAIISGESSLHLAAKQFDPEYLKIVLKAKNLNVDIKTSVGLTPLMESCLGMNRQGVQMLIDAGANVNLKTSMESSALLIAASKKDPAIVKSLIDAGANVNDQNGYKSSVLISALEMHGGASMLDQVEWNGKVGISLQEATVVIAKMLLDAGANVNHLAKSGLTPLESACKFYNKDVIELLLDKGANAKISVMAGPGEEYSALMIAAFKGEEELFKKMIQNGADVHYKNKKGENVLYAALNGVMMTKGKKGKEIVKELIDHYPEVVKGKEVELVVYHLSVQKDELSSLMKKIKVEEKDQFKILEMVLSSGDQEAFKELIDAGLNPLAKDAEGNDLMHSWLKGACNNEVLQKLRLMMQSTDLKIKNQAREVYEEFKTNFLETTDKLIQLGLDLNEKNKKGETPMAKMVESFLFQADELTSPLVEMILNKGAKACTEAEDPYNPVFMAFQHESPKAFELLAKKTIEQGQQEQLSSLFYELAWIGYPEKKRMYAVNQPEFLQQWAELIQRFGVNPSYQDDDGQFPLLIAASNGHEELLNLLIKLNVDVNQVNNEQENAAFHSIQQGHDHLTRNLLDNGLNPFATNKEGVSLLQIAQKYNKGNTRSGFSSAIKMVMEVQEEWTERQKKEAETGASKMKM